MSRNFRMIKKGLVKVPFKDQNLTIYLDQEFIMNGLEVKELYWKE
jgi:hypothetical protein